MYISVGVSMKYKKKTFYMLHSNIFLSQKDNLQARYERSLFILSTHVYRYDR